MPQAESDRDLPDPTRPNDVAAVVLATASGLDLLGPRRPAEREGARSSRRPRPWPG